MGRAGARPRAQEAPALADGLVACLWHALRVSDPREAVETVETMETMETMKVTKGT
jgi:hypothetical protein